jgi:septum formation protein
VLNWPSGVYASLTDVAEVRFKGYGLADIKAYIAAEPPYDKAGAYAIQGIWQRQVASLEGDLETVIGLPYRRLAEIMRVSGDGLAGPGGPPFSPMS